MLFFSYQDNITIAYPSLTSLSDSKYVGGRASFLAANILTIIGLAVEFVIMLSGVNMFKERLNFLVSTIHYLGAILFISYGFGQWQFDTLWALWFVFSFIPVSMEIVASCYPQK